VNIKWNSRAAKSQQWQCIYVMYRNCQRVTTFATLDEFVPSTLQHNNSHLMIESYSYTYWKSLRNSVTQEILHLLWIQKVHYRDKASKFRSSLLCSLLHPPATSTLLCLHILLSNPFSNTLHVLPLWWGTKFHTHTERHVVYSHIYVLRYEKWKTEKNYSGLNNNKHSPEFNLLLISSWMWIWFKSSDSSVGIATGYGLDDRGSRVRFPEGAGNLSLHRVPNGSGAHPASYPMGTGGGSFSVSKAAGAWSSPLTSI
jgi:hypothetical protein